MNEDHLRKMFPNASDAFIKANLRRIGIQDNPTIPVANVEPATRNGSLAKKESARLDSRCNVHVHSKRKRLADSDGISAKATLDGIVRAGLLVDDSPKYVANVSQSQEVSEVEETIIEIRMA